jgi:uracil-DNA glycosylase
MKRILVVGQATGKDGGRPWESEKPCRLYRWFGVSTYAEMKSLAHLMNVADYDGKDGKGDGWLLNRKYVMRVFRLASEVDLVFLVGHVAQWAVLGQSAPKDCCRQGQFVCIPHPSGVNRALNDGGDERVRRFVQGALKAIS